MNPTILAAVGVAVIVSSCDPLGYFGKGKAAKEIGVKNVAVIEENGVSTGDFEAGSLETQRMSAASDSEIAGAYIDMPPGALAVNTKVSLEEGSPLTNLDTLDELGLGDSDATSAGSTVLVTPEKGIDPDKPFTLAVNFSGASLTLQDAKQGQLAIIFKGIIYNENQKYVVGVIPPSQVKIKGNQLVFSATYWGSYQAIRTTADLNQVEQKESKSGIIAKKDSPSLKTGEMGLQIQKVAPLHKFNWYVEALDQDGKVIKTSETWRFETQ
jgi:hypothetical protein